MYRALPARVAGRINNKGFRWKKGGGRREREREKKRGGKGILRGSCLYAGLFLSRSGPHSPFAIISLSHSHIPPLRPVFVLPSPLFPHPRWPLKFWALHCWKITGPPSSSASSLCPLEKIPLAHANWVRTRRVLSSSSSRHIVSLSFLVRLGSLRSPSSSRYRIHHSTPLQGLLFARLLVPSCSLHLSYSLAFRISRVGTTPRVFSIFHLSFSLSLFLSLYLVICFLPCLSFLICLLLFSAVFLLSLSFPLYLAFSLSRISSPSRTNFHNLLQSLFPSLSLSFLSSLLFNLSLASSY